MRGTVAHGTEADAVEMTVKDARDATLALLARRAPGATVCPSEVARILATAAGAGSATDDWRAAMPTVHQAVDRLVLDGSVTLSWKGKPLPARAGPYRIGHGPSE